ncbi:DUF2232 domain-containing protein [Lacicoccus alkaliphilus]|uniref:Predicted membrane protein n=1 Tax=Lacicoccus alkaliphilus DSM 16010 TaxID=1123231 RepID=A0A1M7GJP7_9BACL|nr:DUF2232 domain-containing protein [Salinicoccus alkaliphilus]SHM16157.1 Predicted membrane protein [Salinicoccus alkaliphilus DSM 16010]
MKPNVSLGQTFLAILISFIFITITSLSVLLGAVILPLVVYYLLNIKHKSNYHFWLIFISFMLPAFLFLTPVVWMWFVVLYILTAVLYHTLSKGFSQELTLFYGTFALMLSVVGGLNLLQMTGIINPLADTYTDVRNWYVEQVEDVDVLNFAALDADLFRTALDQLFIQLPAFITVASFFVVLYTVLMLRLLLQNKELQAWPYMSFKDWAFPRFILYLFFILYIISLFTSNDDTFGTIISNAYVVVEWAVFLHGLSFAYFFFLEKKLNKVVAILLLIPLAILRPLTIIIGLLEMVFRFRLLMKQKRK